MDEPALADRHRLLRYHRAGFAGSDRVEGPISMAEHAAHCALLMRLLGIERAHVVGHSSSAAIALQLALDFPDAVHTLVLMEPARPVPPTEQQADFVREFVAPAIQRYRAGDKAGAVDTFARGVFGPDYRGPLEQGLPGAFEQAVADADAFFAQELPALQQWTFTQEDASAHHPARARRPRRAHRPDLSRAAASCCAPGCRTSSPSSSPDATHLLHLQNPRAHGREARGVLRPPRVGSCHVTHDPGGVTG